MWSSESKKQSEHTRFYLEELCHNASIYVFLMFLWIIGVNFQWRQNSILVVGLVINDMENNQILQEREYCIEEQK